MTPALLLVLLGLATARATRLVTRDVIVRGPREWLIARSYRHRPNTFGAGEIGPGEWDELARDDDDGPKLATLLVCPWCAGVWLGAGLVAVTWPFVSLPLPGLWFAAVPLIGSVVVVATDD